jgi:hypothetical protein
LSSDDERLVAEWTEKPFVSYDKRTMAVENRIILERHEGVGVDIRREVRSTDYDGLPDEWTVAEVYEVRDHSIERISTKNAGVFS